MPVDTAIADFDAISLPESPLPGEGITPSSTPDKAIPSGEDITPTTPPDEDKTSPYHIWKFSIPLSTLRFIYVVVWTYSCIYGWLSRELRKEVMC